MAHIHTQTSAPHFSVDQGLEYYAGKAELLDWVNRLLDLNLQRLEQLTSAAVYCQILDAFYADVVAIRKVNFLAREDYEIIPNYKVLQAAFNALGYTKEVDVPKLSQASAPELTELTQWFYKTYKGRPTQQGYNPVARRMMSQKGATNDIPFPSCIVLSSLDFTRSDLRASGHWSFTSPQEQTRTSSRTLRTFGSTPHTAGKSTGGSNHSSRRGAPYLNVTSRYRDGLVAPPENYERRSPRLSLGYSGETRPRVLLSTGSTQTDFVDEEYRMMTAADVGTEVVSRRTTREEEVFDAASQTGSFASQSFPGSPSHIVSCFSFGRPHALAARMGSQPGSPSSKPTSPRQAAFAQPEGVFDAVPPESPRADASTQVLDGEAPLSPRSDVATQVSSSREMVIPDGVADQVSWSRSPSPEGVKARITTEATTDAEHSEPGVSGDPHETGPNYLPTAFENVRNRDPSFADRTMEPQKLATPSDSDAIASFGSTTEVSALAKPEAAAPSPIPGPPVPAASPRDASLSASSLSAALLSAASPSANGLVPDPSSSPIIASTTPSPSKLWRSSGTPLPPEVAALLASPAARTRMASATCQRDMATALDVCGAALAATDKSLDAFKALLATVPAAAPSGDGSTPRSSVNGGVTGCTPALCGKARSLQDALQTVLSHASLLLSDVQAYSEATYPQTLTGSPTKSRGLEQAASGISSVTSAETSGSQRNFSSEAAALLETTRSHQDRFQELSQQGDAVLQLPGDYDASSQADAANVAPSPREASSAEGAGPRRHLTEEQRKLASTALLDSHLKALGMAQFTFVQDVHKELAALTASYFRHTGATGGGVGDGSAGGGDGSAGGISTASRKARVFKLGDYQLKQLRNGDVYKGRYVCNKKNGEGVYHFINADVYEGEFRDDRMDGYGVYTFSHEGRYEGQWRNAVYNGTGAETFAKGSTYHGEYAGGLRNGWGVCRFYNGDYYEGQWAKGLRDGCGMQQCTDDSNFVGDYQRGKRHGHGVYSFPNGDRYEGQYLEDLPHGHGTYHFASGQCYQGQWQQGKKHGWSVYTVDNGSRFMGLWSEGKPTWVQPLNADSSGAGTEVAEPFDSASVSKALRQATEAQELAEQAATDARKRATAHWEVGGTIQSKLQTALSQAQASAGVSQQARRKACDLASRLDAAVSLLQTQGSGTPVPSTTP